MEDTLRCKLFAIDLINYKLEDNDFSVPREAYMAAIGESPFIEIIGEAVILITEYHEFWYHIEFRNLLESTFILSAINPWCVNFACRYFQKYDYSADSFLQYCGRIVYLVDEFYARGYHHIMVCMADAIASALTVFILTGKFKKEGGWEALHNSAYQLIKQYKSGRIESDLPVGILEDKNVPKQLRKNSVEIPEEDATERLKSYETLIEDFEEAEGDCRALESSPSVVKKKKKSKSKRRKH